MIITQQKAMDEIQRMLEPFEKLFIIGCGTCSTECQTGGEEQIMEMVGQLERMGKMITGTAVVESPCDARILRRDTRKFRQEIEAADALLCMACGAGVQDIAEHIDKICIPCLDTKFIGQTERIGQFYERCRACGECILFETGGVCPIVRCPKSMLNGPCGGMYDGKCEVGGHQRDCTWILIYDRLNHLGLTGFLREYNPPRDNSKLNVEPREIIWVERRAR